MRLATNAPAHWPVVDVQSWDSRKTWNNTEPVAVALDRGFVAAGKPCPIVIFGSRLEDQGVLEVPIQVTDKGQKYCVFLYADSPDSAARFAGARAIVEANGAKAVYYAPAPLAEVPAANPCGPFHMRYIAGYGQPAPVGKYAMWWTTPSDADFTRSKTYGLIEAFYQVSDGIETFILADVLNAIGHRGGGRIALPEQSAQLAIYGPEERLMMFSASSKGLRFCFPIESTPTRYRDQFWTHVLEWARRFRTNIETAGAELDPPTHRRGLHHWNFVAPMLREHKEQTEMFGPLLVMDDQKK